MQKSWKQQSVFDLNSCPLLEPVLPSIGYFMSYFYIILFLEPQRDCNKLFKHFIRFNLFRNIIHLQNNHNKTIYKITGNGSSQ